MTSLAEARPPRLDADRRPGVTWPEARDFARDDSAIPANVVPSPSRSAHPGQATARQPRRRRQRRGAARSTRRIIPATAAAIAMGVVIALIVVARMELHHRDESGPRPVNSRDGSSVAFSDLGLTGRWRGHVEYGVAEGIVYLDGYACHTTAGRGPIATLPRSARPARPIRVVVAVGKAGNAELAVWPNGQLTTTAGNCRATQPDGRYVQLSGVSFPLES